MDIDAQRPPVWLGGLVAILGIAGVLVAGVYWPVEDPQPLKMSCFWASRAIVPLSAMIALCGIQATATTLRPVARAAAWLAIGAAALQVITIHWVVPFQHHSLLHQRVHDLMAIATAMVALAGLSAMATPAPAAVAPDAEAEPEASDTAEPTAVAVGAAAEEGTDS